ncbi:MAG: KH domain-containing protein [Christensenellales bacterium]
MEEILKTIIENLVENKEEVKITRIDDEKGILLKVKVAQEDMGKVIGKQGKVARAIRTIMKSITSNEQKNVGVIFEEE